jgi:hypothetical protein
MVKLRVKSVKESSEKWSEITPGRASEWTKRAVEAIPDMLAKGIAAEPAYKAAMTLVINQGRRQAGLRKVPADETETMIRKRGEAAFSNATAIAGPKYERKFGPYQDELGKIDVSARKEVGNVANYKIVQEIGDALHERKLRELGVARVT